MFPYAILLSLKGQFKRLPNQVLVFGWIVKQTGLKFLIKTHGKEMLKLLVGNCKNITF